MSISGDEVQKAFWKSEKHSKKVKWKVWGLENIFHTEKFKRFHLLSLLKYRVEDGLIMVCEYIREEQISHSQLFNLAVKKHNEIQQLEA